jgi:nicotinamidase/pyrazinamidase
LIMTHQLTLPREGDALVVVDVQNDFMPGGALGIPLANLIIAPLNRYLRSFEVRGLPVFATRDWHPPDHCSFHAQGGPWPSHCVQETQGAGFFRNLQLPTTVRVVSKGTDANAEAYSGFQGTDLEPRLRELGCSRIILGGLATEYCVLATALDARAAGFEVVVLEDAIRGADVAPDDSKRAVEKMAAAGVEFATSTALT